MIKILLIEDDRTIRESILDFLQDHGFEVYLAENGPKGVELALGLSPDIILCDVVMPGMDGYGVLSSLRQSPATRMVPFIFLTGQTTKEQMRHAMELGADDYLTKPCSADELLRAISSRLQKQATIQDISQQRLEDLRSSITLSLPHELRTPLNGILGFAELLMGQQPRMEPEEVQEIAGQIYQAADRLSHMIQKFLLHAELEMSRHDPELLEWLQTSRTESPDGILTDIATEIAQKYGRETDLQLNLNIVPINIGEREFSILIRELVDNAFKFSQPGQRVKITSWVTEQGVSISITDQGRGMTPEQITKLGAYMQFDRNFYEQQGSGLGLAIAQKILHLHHSKLSIEAIPGQRTIVRINLPKSL